MDIKERGEVFALLLAEQLKDAVKNAGYTQREVAKIVGSSGKQINMYLNGVRTLPADFYSRICAAIERDPIKIVDDAYQALQDVETGKRPDPRIIPIWKLAAKDPGYSAREQAEEEENNQP